VGKSTRSWPLDEELDEDDDMIKQCSDDVVVG
jgi:hypothetical protein